MHNCTVALAHAILFPIECDGGLTLSDQTFLHVLSPGKEPHAEKGMLTGKFENEELQRRKSSEKIPVKGVTAT